MVYTQKQDNKWNTQKRKERRRQQRRDRVLAREAAWVADYEQKQAKALGLSAYRLPGGVR